MGVWFRAPSTVSSVDSDSDDSISEIPKDDHLPFDAQVLETTAVWSFMILMLSPRSHAASGMGKLSAFPLGQGGRCGSSTSVT